MEDNIPTPALNTDTEFPISIIETVEDLDLYSAVKLKKQFLELTQAGYKRFIVNMVQTKYVDSSGLGALINMHTYAMKNKEIFILLVNVASTILQVIKLTRIEHMFRILPDLETAIKEIREEKVQVTIQPVNPEPEISQAENPLEEVTSHEVIKQISIKGNSPLFNKDDLKFKEFFITLKNAGEAAAYLTLTASPRKLEETSVLEQQIYELIKNAVKHGNKNKKKNSVKVWYSLSEDFVRLIIKDEGKGFRELEKWNSFYRTRMLCYQGNNYQKLIKYLSFKSSSDRNDAGRALFSSIDYWNGGLIFDEKRTSVAVKKLF